MALLRSLLPVKDRQADLLLLGGAMVLFLLSAYYGTNQFGPVFTLPLVGLKLTISSTFIWVALGAASLAFFREAVEDVWWPNGAWLVAAYIVLGLGGVFLAVGRQEGFLWWFFGLLLLALGILLLIQLWLSFYKDRAQLMRANPDVDPDTFTLGSWNMALPAFIVGALATYYFWALWYLKKDFMGLESLDTLWIYIALDGVVFAIAIYLMYIPQQNLGRFFIKEVEPVAGVEGLALPGGGALPRRMVKQLDSCQFCQADTRLEQRKCPACQTHSTFGWCPACEHFSVLCPECNQPSGYGSTCQHCEADLTSYTCPNCSNSDPLRKWASV